VAATLKENMLHKYFFIEYSNKEILPFIKASKACLLQEYSQQFDAVTPLQQFSCRLYWWLKKLLRRCSIYTNNILDKR